MSPEDFFLLHFFFLREHVTIVSYFESHLNCLKYHGKTNNQFDGPKNMLPEIKTTFSMIKVLDKNIQLKWSLFFVADIIDEND
jgi:hypothetical protein